MVMLLHTITATTNYLTGTWLRSPLHMSVHKHGLQLKIQNLPLVPDCNWKNPSVGRDMLAPLIRHRHFLLSDNHYFTGNLYSTAERRFPVL